MLQTVIQYVPQMWKAVSAGITATIPAYAAIAQQVPWYVALVSAIGSGLVAGALAWKLENQSAPA